MVVTFEYEYLKDLYEEGKSPDKKHRFQPDIVKRYQKAILTICNIIELSNHYK